MTKKTKLSKFFFKKFITDLQNARKISNDLLLLVPTLFKKTKIKRDKEIFGHLFVVNKLPAWRSILERI